MRTLTRRDAVSALATGLTTGLITWRILLYLGRALPFGIPAFAPVLVVPVLWMLGVQLGYVLGMWFRPFIQFGKFACIGFANAAVDFGILYVGIALTGGTSGVAFTLLKSCSFAVAVIHSYVWNKVWAFDATKSHGGAREAASFVAVALASLLVNVIAASVAIALRPAAVDPRVWAGVSAALGSAAALVFSFVGFRVFVFTRK
jgi:putative flippase GtrA